MTILSFLRVASVSALLSAASLSAAASDAYGDAFKGSGFVSGDWQLVCDNTLTCRAAGYTDEVDDWRGSVLMTVTAGEKTPRTQVLLNYWEASDEIIAQINAANEPVELWLNDKPYGEVENGELTSKQTAQLIKHARQNTKIVLARGDYHWQISDKGMAAVLLKLDDVQGRVGTSLALVSKNNLNRQTPKAANAKPIIKKAFVYADPDKQPLAPSTLSYFQDNIDTWVDIDSEELMGTKERMGECELVNPKTKAYQRIQEYSPSELNWTFIPVDSQYTLAVHSCWTGAYNFGSGYWLIDNTHPQNPQLITTSGSRYDDGEIFAAHKGRGLGDCWSMTHWVWDGKTFAKALEQTTGLCRLIEAGGAWGMPTYVSEVVISEVVVSEGLAP